MRECSNDVPLSGIRLTGPKNQKHSNNSHQEVRLDEAHPDQGVMLHEPKQPGSNYPAPSRGGGAS